jgi:hypothetical protein
MARAYISLEVGNRVRTLAKNRCGYCLSPQHLVMAKLEIEHIIPLAKGGGNEEENLWLACPICNRYKGDKIEAVDPESGQTVILFNPRTMSWKKHFRWSDDGLKIIGLTATGRATVGALQLSDDPDVLVVRSYWVEAGWHPPSD